MRFNYTCYLFYVSQVPKYIILLISITDFFFLNHRPNLLIYGDFINTFNK